MLCTLHIALHIVPTAGDTVSHPLGATYNQISPVISKIKKLMLSNIKDDEAVNITMFMVMMTLLMRQLMMMMTMMLMVLLLMWMGMEW